MATLLATIGIGGAAAGTGLASTLQTVGTVLSMGGSLVAGSAAAANADFQAQQLEQKADLELATATRKAAEEDRQKELVISRARAVGAKSGGGVDYTLLGDLEEEGTYRTLVANWEGEEAARGLRAQAAATRTGGKAKRLGHTITAFDTLVGDIGSSESLLSKYG